MPATEPPVPPTPDDGTSAERVQLELKSLRKQYEKLTIEVQALKDVRPWERWVSRLVPIVSSLIAVGGFLFGVLQYTHSQAESEKAQAETDRKAAVARLEVEKAAQKQRQDADETQRLDIARETTKPLWDRQLSLYLEAAETAATIATTDDDATRRRAENRFWVLYWGPLAAVEDVGLKAAEETHIEGAMVRFADAMNFDPKSKDLTLKSLELAHAIRQAILPAFNVKAAHIEGAGKRGGK